MKVSLWLAILVGIGCSDTTENGPAPAPDVVIANTHVASDAQVTTPPPEVTGVDKETSPPVVGPEVKILEPCTQNSDCASAFCVESADGRTCTESCVTDCPKDWYCGEVSSPAAGADLVYACLHRFVTLCKPCMNDADCTNALGASGAQCLHYGQNGSFCGAECGAAGGCPDGYACDDGQCRLQTGECGCSWKAIKDGAKTACFAVSELGQCPGERTCLDGATLSTCSAKAPSAETCNSADDDCDGETDEDTGGEACANENDLGKCTGTLSCAVGKLVCSAAAPEAEACDGADNDCDGATDEGHADADADGVADCIETDDDGDGVPDAVDDCPSVANPGQEDLDNDGVGDACDADLDGDGDPNGTDCAPQDPAVGHKAVETCNGKDDDCDEDVDEGFPDLDGDTVADCMDDDIDGDGVANAEDNCPVTPNADQGDTDGDGKGDVCDQDKDSDGDPDATDCQPLDPAAHHGAKESCNGADENCNGIVDEGYPDTDGDGVADCLDGDDDGDGVPDEADNCPLGANSDQLDVDGDGLGDACDGDDDGDGDPDALDCAPYDAAVSHKAAETCNGKDDDCDQLVDEEGASGCATYYFNEDGDGYGVGAASKCLCAAAPPWSATEGGDCNDKNAQVFPNATEVCNGKDDDCDEAVDEGAATGCKDAWTDADKDGFGAGESACVCPGAAGTASVAGDCDDASALAHPGALETCDGHDNDCDGLTDEAGAFGCEKWYADGDKDGFGVAVDSACLCAATGEYVAKVPGDCADDDEDVWPGKVEVCDAKDDNCNGQVDEGVKSTFYLDSDKDGYGAAYNTKEACAAPAGYVDQGGDCNDFNAAIGPGTPEVCDGIDNTCDGQVDEGLPTVKVYVDLDGDGHGAKGTAGAKACLTDSDGDGEGDAPPNGTALTALDCNDSASLVFPGAPELCDGILNDCNAPVADYQCPTLCEGSWPVFHGVTSGSVAVGQMDTTNAFEVVVQGNGKVAVLRADGSEKWSESAIVQYSNPLLADTSGDGFMDVVLIETNRFRILDGKSGAELESFKVVGTGWRPGAAFDLDADGHVDLVGAASGTLAIVLRDGAGGAKASYAIKPPAGASFDADVVAVTDVDGDGGAEVIVGTGYYTCNAPGAPKCQGQVLIYDGATGLLESDPLTQFVVPDAGNAYAGGPSPIVADLDGDGEDEIGHYFGNNVTGGALRAWNLDGTPATTAITGSAPRLAPIDDAGKLLLDGTLRDIAGGAVDLDGDGVFEVVRAGGGGFVVTKAGQVMDGYPVKVSAGVPLLADVNRDGRLDVLFVGGDNASVNCYTLGEGTASPKQVLTSGAEDVLAASRYRTGSVDPYEPNDVRNKPFDAPTSTSPIADSRAMPIRGFLDKYSSSNGWSRNVSGMLGHKGDRDYFWAVGGGIHAALDVLAGPADYDLAVHIYKKVAGSYVYITTWTAAEKGGGSVYCHPTCPDAANAAASKTFILEVRGKDEAKDYGPWPYNLRILFGAQ